MENMANEVEATRVNSEALGVLCNNNKKENNDAMKNDYDEQVGHRDSTGNHDGDNSGADTSVGIANEKRESASLTGYDDNEEEEKADEDDIENEDKDKDKNKNINPNADADADANEDEDADEDEDEDEDEDDEPPLLKYTRVTKLPSNLFMRDSISACLFYDNFFMFGTHSGLLHFTKPDFTAIQTIKCHRSSILSIHTEGNYFASASIDGTVAIGMVDDPSNVTAFDFKRPVQAVVLDKDYRTSKTFVSGGMAGEVILSQRNWLGNRMDVVLTKGRGPIVGIYTMDDVILWMNDDGITFSGIHSKTQLLNVPFPQDGIKEVRPDLYRPHVNFPEVDRIIVGWGSHIWMFKVSLAKPSEQGTNLGSIISSAASSLRAIPDKKVELEHHFSIKTYIAGISSFKDDQLMCLGISESSDEDSTPNIPEIKIIDALSGEEVNNDEVMLKNYKNLTLNDYHLGKHIEKSSPEYFLISASDAIRIQVLTLEDHYNWYVQKEEFLQAWQIGAYVVDDYTRLKTGVKAVEKLIEHGQWDEAASDIELIITNTDIVQNKEFKIFAVDLWEQILEKIIDSGHIKSIAQKLPVESLFKKPIYDSVLAFYMKEDLRIFFSLIKKWPPKLYSIQHFEDRLEESIEVHDSLENSYREVIIYLYLSQKRYSKAIPHMIDSKDVRALDVLLSHSLVSQFTSRITEIVMLPYHGNVKDMNGMSIDQMGKIFHKSIELLVQSRHSLKVSHIVSLLSETKCFAAILFLYLKRISLIDPVACAPFENRLIELYAKYDGAQLLKFLKSKSNYDVEKAIEFCSKRKGLSNELIYLWGKIGENKKALSLIIDDLNDPHLAINFVKDWGDSDLWEFMIGYSMDKPKFIKALLDSPDEFGKTYLEVIRVMPSNMEIEGLQDTLKRISKENSLNLRVHKSVLKIVDDDTREVCVQFLNIRNMGKVFRIEDQL